jgi:hypothetical protein
VGVFRMLWGKAMVVGSLSVLAVACGAQAASTFSASGGTPCESIYRGLCGGACGDDQDCADPLSCVNGTCGAVCSPNHACADGSACTSRGRCASGAFVSGFVGGDRADGDGQGNGICADTDLTLTKLVPRVVFLLDQSSSMFYHRFPTGLSNGCNPDCRWTTLKDVLIGPASKKGGLMKQLEGQAELAVEMYSATDSDPNDDDNSFLSGATENVCPRFNGKAFGGLSFSTNAFASVDAMLRPASVDDDTPTGPAIRRVVGLDDSGAVVPGGLAALPGTAPKLLVLVTDGEPGLCGDNQTSNLAKQDVVSAVQQTYAKGIRSFVIAIGDMTTAGRAHFKAVANAGTGQDPVSGTASAMTPSTQEQLLTALKDVVLDARTCTFDLNGQVGAGKESLGTVTLNGASVPFDAQNGWRLVSPSRLELVGGACNALKTSENAQLSARFPCGAITPIVR